MLLFAVDPFHAHTFAWVCQCQQSHACLWMCFLSSVCVCWSSLSCYVFGALLIFMSLFGSVGFLLDLFCFSNHRHGQDEVWCVYKDVYYKRQEWWKLSFSEWLKKWRQGRKYWSCNADDTWTGFPGNSSPQLLTFILCLLFTSLSAFLPPG